MRDDDHLRPGGKELRLAVRSAGVAIVTLGLAQVTALSSSPIALSATFLLYLAAILGGVQALVATTVGVRRRRG